MLGSVSDIGSSEVCQFGVGGNPQIAAGQKHIEHTFFYYFVSEPYRLPRFGPPQV